jgi:type IV secretion system protein VirB10
MILRPVFTTALLVGVLAGQEPAPTQPAEGWPKVSAPAAGDYQVAAGTKVPLSLINSISTKHSAEGDRVYLETAFPILSGGKIVIPVGSYVAGTVTQVKRPGRVKGRGELFVRFDSLTLPNGVTRDFRARMGGMDGASNEELDRAEGKVKSEGNKGGDARTIGEAAGTGASVGAIAGSVGGNAGKGLGIGAAAGAAAGLIGVLASRGPDAILAKGTTIEMVLDRTLSFSEADLNFGNYQPPRAARSAPPAEPADRNNSGTSSRRRLPF